MDRKTFVRTTALAGAASMAMPRFSFGLEAKGSDKIKVALVGCGGRGTGALCNMIDADQNIEIIALGDIFKERADACTTNVSNYIDRKYPSKKSEIWKVTPETVFLGLDSIDKVLQTDADVVALVTPPVFRTQQIEKCLNANKNVFAEKPICIDPVQYRKICNDLIPLADKKGLSVLCGTQMRYQSAIQEAIDRLRDGQIGDVVSAVCLRFEAKYLTGWYKTPENLKEDDVEFQLRNWLAYRWTSGDQMVEQYIHNLDLALWAIGDMPVEVVGSGGRHADIPLGDRLSNCHAMFWFDKGISLTAGCRQEDGASPFSTLKIYGTKGLLSMSFGKQVIIGEKPWKSEAQKKPELICEHEALFGSIRNGKPIQTMRTCADSCFVAIAGREAAYGGKRVKCAWFKEKSELSYMPESLSLDGKKAIEPIPTPLSYKLV